MSFYSALKKKISIHHMSQDVDNAILQKSQNLLKKKQSYEIFQKEKKSWVLSLSSFAVACLVIVVFSQLEKQSVLQQEIAKMEAIIDPTSIEFIKHHEEIELMSESAEWSEEEWAIALNKEPSENS